MCTDVSRFALIEESNAADLQVAESDLETQRERLKREYRDDLDRNLRILLNIYRDKLTAKLKNETKLRGHGGAREEAALLSNVNATFGMTYEDALRRFMRPGVPALSQSQLAEFAEEISLYVLSTLEFQNNAGRQLIF